MGSRWPKRTAKLFERVTPPTGRRARKLRVVYLDHVAELQEESLRCCGCSER